MGIVLLANNPAFRFFLLSGSEDNPWKRQQSQGAEQSLQETPSLLVYFVQLGSNWFIHQRTFGACW